MLIKGRKKATKRLVLHQVFHPTLHKLTKFLDVEMLWVYQKKTEVGGANSISDDEFNTNSDPDSDNNKSNVLKQVPKKILVKGDAGKLKKIFSAKVFLGFLTLVFAH